jgi:uncharacterized protein (DUF488 family)
MPTSWSPASSNGRRSSETGRVADLKMFTIGHSTHPADAFTALLEHYAVTTVADVRSVPASRYAPQFNQRNLQRSLRAQSIHYIFLGAELGARSDDPSCYRDGRVQYDRLARLPAFKSAIGRLLLGAQSEIVALMCAERDPLECHRTLLVAQALMRQGVHIDHIHGDGSLESHASAMSRLMASFGLAEDDLFRTEADRLSEALQLQERRIAYVNSDFVPGGV